MSQVHSNPDELRELASRVGLFCADTRERLAALESMMNNVGETSWSDLRYREFSDKMDRLFSTMRLAIDEIEPEEVQRLLSLASILEEYRQA